MRKRKTGFKCEAAEFNGAECTKQCARCKAPPRKMSEPTLEWFKPYEVRKGKDGRMGIYTRDFNCRLATFNVNTHALQTRLKLLFDRAHAEPSSLVKATRKTDKRQNPGARSLRRNEAWGPGSGNW